MLLEHYQIQSQRQNHLLRNVDGLFEDDSWVPLAQAEEGLKEFSTPILRWTLNSLIFLLSYLFG